LLWSLRPCRRETEPFGQLLLCAAALLVGTPAAAMAQAAKAPDPLASVRAFGPGQPNRGLKIVPLTLTTADGRAHRYRVEVAATPAEQATGMMYRTEMARDTGMIFPFGKPRPAAFWMRNTFISLDLIFVGADGRVRNIAARAKPLSESLLASDGPVVAVLELRGGEAERIGLRPGDRVDWPGAGIGGGRGAR
jgi:uncharacterized membrane protein (UPF0127 family)